MKYVAVLCLLGVALAAYTPEYFFNKFDSATLRPVADAFRTAAFKTYFSKTSFADVAQLRTAAAEASAPEVATVAAAALYAASENAVKYGVSNKEANVFKAAAYESLSKSYSPMSFEYALKAATASGIPSSSLSAIREVSSKYPISNSQESTAALKAAASYAKGFAPETIAKIRAAASEASALGAAFAKYFALRTAYYEAVASKQSEEIIAAYKKAADYATTDVIRTGFMPAAALTKNFSFVFRAAKGFAYANGLLEDLEPFFAQIKDYQYSSYSSDRSSKA